MIYYRGAQVSCCWSRRAVLVAMAADTLKFDFTIDALKALRPRQAPQSRKECRCARPSTCARARARIAEEALFREWFAGWRVASPLHVGQDFEQSVWPRGAQGCKGQVQETAARAGGFCLKVARPWNNSRGAARRNGYLHPSPVASHGETRSTRRHKREMSPKGMGTYGQLGLSP